MKFQRPRIDIWEIEDNEGLALLDIKILIKIQSLVTGVFGPEKEK